MRTINIVNAGSNDYRQGHIIYISGTPKAYKGIYYVDKIGHIINSCNVSIYLKERLGDIKTDNKPKKYKSTFIKSHKRVW